MKLRRTPFRSFRACLLVAIPLGIGPALAADVQPPQTEDRVHSNAFTIACGGPEPCRPQAGPGPADREAHPFAGSLGRPCAWRWRDTPSGTRKVRVCF